MTTHDECSTGRVNELGGCEPVGQGEEPGRPAAGPIRVTGIEVEAPDPGECFDGTTEFGFQPCETSSIGPPPVTELPATGYTTDVAGIALAATILGAILLRATRRRVTP